MQPLVSILAAVMSKADANFVSTLWMQVPEPVRDGLFTLVTANR